MNPVNHYKGLISWYSICPCGTSLLIWKQCIFMFQIGPANSYQNRYANGKILTMMGIFSPSFSMGTWCSNDELLIMASGWETICFEWLKSSLLMSSDSCFDFVHSHEAVIDVLDNDWWGVFCLNRTALLHGTSYDSHWLRWFGLPERLPLPLQLPLTFWIWATRCCCALSEG